MLLAVVGCQLVGDVGNGCGEEDEVAHHLWSGEYQVEVHAAACDGVVGAGGCDGARLLLGLLQDALVEAHVDVCSAAGVVAVAGDDVGAFAQQTAVDADGCAGDVPCLACRDDSCAVDVEFEDVVVLVHGIVDGLGVDAFKLEGAAHVDVDVAARPGGLHRLVVAVVAAAPGSFAALPAAVVEVHGGPSGACGLAGDVLASPCLFGGQGEEAFHALAHEAIGLAVHVEGTVEGLLLAAPMGDAAVVEVVVLAPEAEVGVDGDERNGWQSQGVRVDWGEELCGLCLTCQ